MKNLIIIVLLGLLIGCGNQSKKAKEGNNQPQTITNIDSVGIAIDELNVDSVDIAIDELDEIEDYEGSLRFVHVFLKREDNNVFLTKYCSEKNINGDEYLIDEGFVKYHSSDSSGIAIKADFLSKVLLDYSFIKFDNKMAWYPQNGSKKGIDSVSITLFDNEAWYIENRRNIFQSKITYFGKDYYSDFDDFEVNDIIEVIIASGCPEECIPYIGYVLAVDSIVDVNGESGYVTSELQYTLWDIICLSQKHPLKRCKLINIDDEVRGTSTMLLYENLEKDDNILDLIYKNNLLKFVILGGNRVISNNIFDLYLINKIINRDSLPIIEGTN